MTLANSRNAVTELSVLRAIRGCIGEGGDGMTVGQLRQVAHLHALDALREANLHARIELFRLASEAARKEEAVARWRGEGAFAVAQATEETCHENCRANAEPERLCA